ncbi:CHAT domain-containing protein [Lactifluus subvellereus]|nr:CHAT domain-containing protein [Lactifluus subvellereus]
MLNVVSPDHSHRPVITAALERLQERRFNDFGVAGLEEPRSSNSHLLELRTSRNQSPVLAEWDAVKPRVKTAGEDQHIGALLTLNHITNIADIEEAIKYCRLLLTSSHPSGLFGLLPAIGLTIFLLRAFEQTDKIEYLNEAIAVLRDVLKIPRTGDIHLVATRQLTSSLSTRVQLLNQKEDLEEIMRLFPTAINERRSRVPERFQLSCEWASLARDSNHPTTQTAYENAISLMQDSLTFAPTLEVQHFRLVAMRESYEKLPLDYASFQIGTGRLEQAIETLEQGRALLWSEMRGLRTSVEQLRAADSHLAEQFAAVNRGLETLTMSSTPSGSVETDDGEVDGRKRMDPFSRLVVQQRQLLEKREKLISQIQALPDFEGFLKSPQFDTLRSAASHGPVIIINHCEWRSDILILLHDSPPSLITTAFDFYDRANSLKNQLLDARKEGLDSKQYENALSSILKELYDLVGRPVIQRLCELNVPEQSRVWFCPTSVFCILPLHAMGPIPSDDGAKRYFLDLYIPSYTPTLSPLIGSQKGGAEMFETPSILLVGQPDNTMPEAFKEVQVVQAIGPRVTSLISDKATPSTVLERLRDHQFTHFVCHGILEPGKPFEASFKLYRGMRLTLLDIVRSRLPDAEFAFLSACHTAELTDESLADEGLHLAAAMQYCGFRSAVGTMWAMADTDGRNLAGNFYKSVFSGRGQSVPYYARTAKALRDAVKKLRRKRGITLERWVNFVHHGA